MDLPCELAQRQNLTFGFQLGQSRFIAFSCPQELSVFDQNPLGRSLISAELVLLSVGRIGIRRFAVSRHQSIVVVFQAVFGWNHLDRCTLSQQSQTRIQQVEFSTKFCEANAGIVRESTLRIQDCLPIDLTVSIVHQCCVFCSMLRFEWLQCLENS